MGVYSNSRFITESFVTAPEPDMSYRGTAGANRIIAEMVENDMAFFDAVIVNDIREAYLTKAIEEGATDLVPQLYALQEAASGGIFAKIGEFLKNIWKKITGLIASFMAKITGSLTTDNKKLVKKFEKQINQKDSALKKMDFKWCDLKSGKEDFDYDQTLCAKSDFLESEAVLLQKTEECVTILYDKNEDGKPFEQLARETSALIRINEDTNFDYACYKGFLGQAAPMNSSELSKACHDYFFDSEETKRGEFNKYKDKITSTLNDSKTRIKGLTKNKNEIDKWFRETIKYYDKISNEFSKKDTTAAYAVKDVSTGNVSSTTAGDDEFRKKMNNKDFVTKNSDGEYEKTTYKIDGIDKSNRAQVISKAASTLKNFYSKMQTCITALLNEQMNAVQFYIKQCRRVWIQAASYSANHESMMMEAIGEAADFDTDQIFNAID